MSQPDSSQITCTLLDNSDVESVTIHPNFNSAVEHGEAMLKTPNLGWIGYCAVDGENKLARVHLPSLQRHER